MRLYLITILIGVSITLSSLAQDNEGVIKLYDQLKSNTNDTAKLEIINRIVELETNESKAESFNKEGIDLCFKILKSTNKDVRQKALHLLPSFLNNVGFFAESKDNYYLAFENYFKAQEIAKRVDNLRVLGQTYNNIGYTLGFTNKYHLTKFYFDSALVTYEKIKDYEGMAYTINNLLFNYREGEKLNEQLELIKKGLQYKLKTGNEIGLASMYNNLGMIQTGLKQYDSAKVSYNTALEVSLRNESNESAVMSYVLMAKQYKVLNKIEECILWYSKAYRLASSCKLNEMIAKSTFELQSLYESTGKKEEAKRYAKEFETVQNFLKSQEEKRNYNIELEQFHVIKNVYADSVFAFINKIESEEKDQENSQHFKWILGIFVIAAALLVWFLIKQKKSASSMD
jgi:tetratricopeptide (TPR) repeat protein